METYDIKIGTVDDVLALREAVLILVDGLEVIAECTEENYQEIAIETLDAFRDILK